jgi:hypothetical protein
MSIKYTSTQTYDASIGVHTFVIILADKWLGLRLGRASHTNELMREAYD